MTVIVTGLASTRRRAERMLLNVHMQIPNGLIDAMQYIRNDMDVTPPLIPKDTGAMEESWAVEPFTNTRTTYTIRGGFMEPYSAKVHENIGSNVTWTKPGSGPKFLELALKRNTNEVVAIVANNIQTTLNTTI